MSKAKAKKSADGLTERQRAFVEQYLVDFNGKQAAIRTGYAEKSAEVQASRLLSNAKVQRVIAERQAARGKKLEITIDRIELEMARVAFSDMRDFAQWGPSEDADQSMQAAEAINNDGRNWDERVPPSGVMLKPSSELTDDQAAAVAQVTETVQPGGGIKYGIKLHDKMGALKVLHKRYSPTKPLKIELTGAEGKPLKVEAGMTRETVRAIKEDILGVKLDE